MINHLITTYFKVAYIIVSQKFCNILVECASLQHEYHVTEAVDAVGGTLNGWCTDTLFIVSLCGLVWFLCLVAYQPFVV